MKHTIMKIFLIISFIPILFCVFAGFSCAINGYSYTTILGDTPTTIYGLKAFGEVFLSDFVALIFLGVIPFCMLYQIVYIVIAMKRR